MVIHDSFGFMKLFGIYIFYPHFFQFIFRYIIKYWFQRMSKFCFFKTITQWLEFREFIVHLLSISVLQQFIIYHLFYYQHYYVPINYFIINLILYIIISISFIRLMLQNYKELLLNSKNYVSWKLPTATTIKKNG